MNIKLIIFAAVALIVGLGGGAGAYMMMAPKHAASDSTHAAGDSLGVSPEALQHKLAAAHDSEHVETIMAPAGEAAAAAPGEGAPAAETHAAPGTVPAPSGAALAAAAHPAPGKPPASAPEKPHVVSADMATPNPADMRGIFVNMKPLEAARILALLPDEQAAGILRQLEPRQAAGILSQLPPDRAAAVSRRLLLAQVGGGASK